eukprot:7783223-Heterocapsa_arctica.AAC.1
MGMVDENEQKERVAAPTGVTPVSSGFYSEPRATARPSFRNLKQDDRFHARGGVGCIVYTLPPLSVATGVQVRRSIRAEHSGAIASVPKKGSP